MPDSDLSEYEAIIWSLRRAEAQRRILSVYWCTGYRHGR
jgi:hypothetical protein